MEFIHRLLDNWGNRMRQFLRTRNIRIDLFWAAKVTDQDGDRISDLQGNYSILKEVQSGPVIIAVGEVQGVSDYRQFYGGTESGLFEKIVKLFFRIR